MSDLAPTGAYFLLRCLNIILTMSLWPRPVGASRNLKFSEAPICVRRALIRSSSVATKFPSTPPAFAPPPPPPSPSRKNHVRPSVMYLRLLVRDYCYVCCVYVKQAAVLSARPVSTVDYRTQNSPPRGFRFECSPREDNRLFADRSRYTSRFLFSFVNECPDAPSG